MRARPVLVLLLTALCVAVAPAQQVADPDFAPPIPKPAFQMAKGPLVLIDEAHHNFHTATGRYKPFADLLARDGYVIRGSSAPFSKASLEGARVLVIANALAARNEEDWSLPTPSAFTDEEVAAVRDWVRDGGSLLLIADHMPFPGAVATMAKAFDVTFSNGFAFPVEDQNSPIVFSRDGGALADHAVSRGRDDTERIAKVATFTGSAFRVAKGATPILVFKTKVMSLEPQEAWQFDKDTPRTDVTDWCQGAVLRHGKGRVAVFGEAAMFSAQLGGPDRKPMGMNSPAAAENARFLLNVAHWLTGLLGD